MRIDASNYIDKKVLASLEKEQAFSFSFSRQERGVLKKVEFMFPSVWAPKHRKIIDGDYAGGYMSFDKAPHTADIMDAASYPFVRIVAVMAVAQTAKTTMVDTFLGWTTKYKPGRILSVYPDETTGKRAMDKRIHKMVEGSPQLARLQTGRKEDKSNFHLQLTTALWEIAWAGSAASMADRSVKYLDLQEVDKYPTSPNKAEGGAIEYAKLRVRAYPDSHKIFITSSPSDETGNIAVVMEKEIETVFVRWVRCPICGHEQLMRFSRETFTWPKGEDGKSIDRKKILSKKLGRYICQNTDCAVKWTDDIRNIAVQLKNAVWRVRTKDGSPGEELHTHLKKHRPRSIGFIVPSWISPLVSLSEVCHDFLRCKDTNLSPEERFIALKDFKNKHEASPWSWVQEDRPVKTVLALRDDRPEGLVPGGNRIAGLVAGVDTQDNSFWFWIMAVGYGLINDQWLVRCGEVPNLAAVNKVLWKDQYCDVDGHDYPVQLALIDSGGHRTEEIYTFCVDEDRRGLVLPSKGREKMGAKLNFGNLEFYPQSKTPIPGGLQLVHVNTKHFKDMAAVKLGIKKDDPGGIQFHAEFQESHAEQLLAEARDKNNSWQQIGSRANHLWDCWILACAASEHLGLRHTAPEDNIPVDEVEVYRSKFMGKR